MKKYFVLMGLLVGLSSCSNNREKVVQSQRGDTKINEGSIPIQANDVTGPETDADYLQERDLGGTPGVTNDTTGSTTSGALMDQTGTPEGNTPNKSDVDVKRGAKPQN